MSSDISQNSSSGANPLALLQKLEADSIGDRAISLEQQYTEVWRGFVFELDDLHLVVPFDGGYEIIPCGPVIPLPLTRDWVKGMTNIRGEIFTVVDIGGFLGREPLRTLRDTNLFLLPDQRLRSALVLKSKISLRTFVKDLPQIAPNELDQELAPYLNTVVTSEDGSQKWGVLNLQKIMKTEEFTKIGMV